MTPEQKQTLTALFSEQKLGVLSTQEKDQPYASLVAFSVSSDLSQLFFFTSRNTRKFKNLKANNRTALLIHSACNTPDAFSRAVSVTILGKAEPLLSENRDEETEERNRFLSRHPELKSFADHPNTVMVRVIPDEYILVSQFQKVETIKMITSG